ncbi:MAG: phage tail sheath subtilisin-like domain-containing protein, partial [Anaerolineales bacterium]|nr:phage tail sheath subtilisin-like domain-containing protein [Anaerolineales bacterium]
NAGATTFSAPTAALDASSLTGGVGGTTAPTEGQRQLAYSRHFSDPDIEDVNILLAGPATVDNAGGTVHGVFMTDLVEKRKDCVACISPDKTDVVNVNNSYTQSTNVKSYFDLLSSSSYTIFDSGYTKQYDKYNDVYRWIPLNGHIGGSCARTDYLEDPWWSPAGLTRGQIRGSVAIAFNPAQVERDLLYRARINPVVTFPGEGTMLYGDKTGLSRNSAFSRINVRRLFLTIEEAIKVAARSVLFEFNDQFTRDSFKAMVDPYLRDVQSRRGIIDYLIVCDETNNTGQVIDNNEFRADFYIKPARSINFVTLTFIATRTGVDFAEVVGRA